jgi:hypothetical protein
MQRMFSALFFVGLGLVVAPAAVAADGFSKLPVAKSGKSNGLLMRIVRYEGNTNGAITVDIKNPRPTPQEFSAKGVYFVPQTDADQAPQRLGAVGPFQVHGGNGPRQRLERMTIAPGATQRLTLDVYCIDSHRASPSSSTKFRVAKDTMPDSLVGAIASDAEKSAAAFGGVSAVAAKPAVQSEVWKNRDKKWIQLDGEGRQEVGKR